VATAPPQIPGLTDWRALARGGFATVWEARQESLNRPVAVKVDQRTLDSETEQRRFLREAGAAGRMSGHPGIVTVHDAGILADDRPFLVMQLCPGGSLTKWVKAAERPSQEQVREVGARIADALAAAHARGVLHRDVKPANILIDAYGNAGLADFGLAALPDPGMELSETIEAITPAYAPPEVFSGKQPTEFGDVYSLAATLYALLAGRAPRWPESDAPSIADVMERQHEPIERIARISRPFMDLLAAGLADDPADRPSAAQFRDRLKALDLTPPPPLNPKRPTRPPRQPMKVVDRPAPVPLLAAVDKNGAATDWSAANRSRRRTWAILALITVLLVVALVVSLVTLSPPAVTGGPVTGGPVTGSTASGPASSPVGSSAPPTPISQAVPAGFVDCREALGANMYCAAASECWAGIFAYTDVLWLATLQDCEETHLYQTFAAGRLAYIPRRQSTLDDDQRTQEVCKESVLNKMLRERDQRSDWEIITLGPQAEDEDFFRCIFGRGNRGKPFKLVPPS
jgi:serine/threonine protein kinase